MSDLRVSLDARVDLVQIANFIANFIAKDSEKAALRFVGSLEARFEFLAASPRAGRSRADLRRGTRAWAVGNYLVIYRIGEG